VTEGTGHVIDPDGDARRALLEAVAEHGPQALSDATIMDNLCRNQLAALPGESILIVSASRADVPALLRDKIPELGNYGAIQSVAATLARASDLDNAASLWVVREFARALGMIAPGGTQPVPRIVPDGPAAGAAAGASAAGAQPQATPGAAAQPPGPAGAGAPAPGPGPGMAAGTGAPPPTRTSSASRVLNRNTVGIAAAIALVAGYLGVAAAAHLSPFPAETVAATSSHSAGPGTSTGAGTGPSTSTSPASSPDASPDVSPTSDYQILLSKIPAAVRRQSNCPFAGTAFGATAVSQCARLSGLGATTIMYYLYPSSAALTSGISSLLSKAHFHKSQECTTGGEFTEFLINCQSDFHHQTPSMTGTIAEFPNTSNESVIVTSDDHQNVMVVMIGTNARDLLAYWNQLNWIVR
jgi:hypothetical protein